MKLDQTFSATAPIDRVWATLMDVEQVARCVPGAQVLDRLSDDSYQVGMKVKLGPITMAYRGQLDVIERDEAAHRATLSGKAKETRGQGTAAATVELHLTADAERTVGTVHADVRLSGRAAAMGQGVIASVADQMLGQFAHNLEVMLAGDDAAYADDSRSGETVADGVQRAAAGTQYAGVIAPPEDAKPGAAPVEQTRGDADVSGHDVSGHDVSGHDVSGQDVSGHDVSGLGAAGAPAPSAPAPGPRAEAGADRLDALALARSAVAAQLQQPRVQLGLAAVLAVLAFLLGRRSVGD